MTQSGCNFCLRFRLNLNEDQEITNWNHNLVTNDEETRPFADHLGYAILNCSVIEQLTYSYAAQLQGEHVFGTGLGGKKFSQRRDHVIQLLLGVNVDDDLRKRAIELWNDANEVMDKRNLVAHNPITRVRIDRTAGGEETMLAVVDMAASTPTNIQSLDARKLANLANRANEVASGLFECLESFKESAVD